MSDLFNQKVTPTRIEIGNNFLTPNVIGNQGLSPTEAIAELIANSFDWRITKTKAEEPTKIKIILTDDSIEIIDNGVGMTVGELNTGLNLAESSDQIRERLNEDERKGRFGMGMKVASLSIGWKFTILTKSIKDTDKQHEFKFNSRELEDPQSNYLEELKIITSTVSGENALSEYQSGTSIKIEDLVMDLPSGSALTVGIQERFSPDINYLKKNGLLDFHVINQDGHSSEVGLVEIKLGLEDDILKLDFENPGPWAKKKEYKYIGYDGKEHQLRGFIQLLKHRSFKEGKYGFDLWCNNQLIEGFHKVDKINGQVKGLFSVAGRAGELTYGVLHLDGCMPDTVKSKGFIIDDAFLAVRELIEDDLQLYKYLGVATKQSKERIKEEINNRRGILPPEEGIDTNDDTSNSKKKNKDLLSDKPEGTIMLSKKRFIQIKKAWVFESALDKSKTSSWEVYPNPSKTDPDLFELQVYINPNSEVYKSIMSLYQNPADLNKITSFFKKIAVCESLYGLCVSEWGFNSEDARRLIDEVVYPQVLELKWD